jgi:predicted nuclease of restriction endonuclease-like (RecB) superfamily
MSKRVANKSKSAAALPPDYAPLLADIKARVQTARIKAGLAANRELLALYWDIGRLILDRQRREGWGAKVIDRLALDLQRAFPGQQGFSPRNLKYMRAFAEAWPETVIGQRPIAPLTEARKIESVLVQAPLAQISAAMSPIVQAPLAQLPWYHHLALLDKLTSPADRLWYAGKAVEHGWSRNVLVLQIESGLHQRQGKAVTNFKTTLPPTQSDLAQGITKDPYLFDFLTLRDDANEHAVEDEFLSVRRGRPFPAAGRAAVHWTDFVPQQKPGDCGICVARHDQANWRCGLCHQAGGFAAQGAQGRGAIGRRTREGIDP